MSPHERKMHQATDSKFRRALTISPWRSAQTRRKLLEMTSKTRKRTKKSRKKIGFRLFALGTRLNNSRAIVARRLGCGNCHRRASEFDGVGRLSHFFFEVFVAGKQGSRSGGPHPCHPPTCAKTPHQYPQKWSGGPPTDPTINCKSSKFGEILLLLQLIVPTPTPQLIAKAVKFGGFYCFDN